LLRTLYRDRYGRWKTTYDTKEFKSTAAWEWLKNLYRQIVSESRDVLTPILGALIGGVIWLAWVYSY
jgi:hypothetical protein